MTTTTPRPFSGELCHRIGLERDPKFEMWRIPGTGWRISDGESLSPGYPWYYSHDEDGRDYGTTATLDEALRGILAANHRGEGDHPSLRLNRWLPNGAIRAAIRRAEKENAS